MFRRDSGDALASAYRNSAETLRNLEQQIRRPETISPMHWEELRASLISLFASMAAQHQELADYFAEVQDEHRSPRRRN